jgi:CheY-like chemotaxis protein
MGDAFRILLVDDAPVIREALQALIAALRARSETHVP